MFDMQIYNIQLTYTTLLSIIFNKISTRWEKTIFLVLRTRFGYTCVLAV